MFKKKNCADTLCARDWKDPKCVKVGDLQNWSKRESCCRFYSDEGISPTLLNQTGGDKNIKAEVIGTADIKGHDQIKRVYSKEGLAPTLNTCGGGNRQAKVEQQTRIRKLTPREYWRLMGFTDSDFDKCHEFSNSQLYKMAGNSIVVQVAEALLRELSSQYSL